MLFSLIPSSINGIYLIFQKYRAVAYQLVYASATTKEIGIEAVAVAPLPDFDIDTTEPRPYRPWSTGKFAMTMGIRKLPEDDLFLLDKQYVVEQKLRRQLLAENREGVIQYLPGSEDACKETLDSIVKFLTKRYPHLFVFIEDKPGYLQNHITNLTFKVTEPFEVHPLEVAAQLVMEDLNLLMQGAGEDSEQHYLRASFSMAPAGWYIQERIGWPLWKIHGPVPLWEEKLRKSIERFFLNLKVSAPVQRNNFFLQTTPSIFQQDPFPSFVDVPPAIEDIIIRHERQTLRRLPKSGAILFTVRTFFMPVTDLESEPESLRELVDSALAMPDEMALYKCRHVWMQTLQSWASTILAEGGEDDVESRSLA